MAVGLVGVSALVWSDRPAPALARAQVLELLLYTVRVRAPDTHVDEVAATIPTGGRDAVELIMPVWSSGYYRVEDPAANVREFTARAPDGTLVDVEKRRESVARPRARPAEGGRLLPARLRAALGHDELGRRSVRGLERRGDVRHARRAGASAARGPARAAVPMDAVHDHAGFGAGRRAEPLPRP